MDHRPPHKVRFPITAGYAIASLVLLLAMPVTNARRRAAADCQVGAAARMVGYDLPFGSGNPFLPSNADTLNHRFILPERFPRAKYCRHCHEGTYDQWRESLHANSFREPFYKKNVDLLIESKGVAYTRHCEGCHNPIALVSGALTTHPHNADRSFDEDGITCGESLRCACQSRNCANRGAS